MLRTIHIIFALLTVSIIFAQQFETLPRDIMGGVKPITFGQILCTTKGTVLIANSMDISEIDHMEMHIAHYSGVMRDNKGNEQFVGKNSNIFKDMTESGAGIKLLCEGPGQNIYVVDENNNFGCFAYKYENGIMLPPFNWNRNDISGKNIVSIWISNDSDLYAATDVDTIFIISKGANLYSEDKKGKVKFTYLSGIDKDSNLVPIQGARTIKKVCLGKGIIAYSFAQTTDDSRVVLIGTNHGLLRYDKETGQTINIFPLEDRNVTVTHINPGKTESIIWISTLEKGMGRLNTLAGSTHFFPYPKKQFKESTKYPILNFSYKSANEFFVAIGDSLPAVFNTETGKYVFINDSAFRATPNKTTDIQADALGNLYITKGGGFYFSKTFIKNNEKLFAFDSSLLGPYITDITINGDNYNEQKNYYFRDELLKEIDLKYNENKIQIFYSARGINSDSLKFAFKLENYDKDWTVLPYSIFGSKLNMAIYDHLKPGTYVFKIKAGYGSARWLKKETQLTINISPPLWQTWWFWLSVIVAVGTILFAVVKWRVSVVRKQERIKANYEKKALELEAKALRAQMNPHFIFNCMNSIKSLIQEKEEEKAVDYLTTFSKLLRTILQNCDKREITLFDELQTCQLYTQLESLRFGEKVECHFHVNDITDLKSVMVPALIIQPFIENAIWHGIMPKEEGGILKVNVYKKDRDIFCEIDDNGIGREMSKQNKFKGNSSTHQSKGIRLTQTRLDLDNILNERNATVNITDKKDYTGKSTGTTVILKFTEDQSI